LTGGKACIGPRGDEHWKSADGQQEFEQFGTTGAEGKYQISSPLPIASYVGFRDWRAAPPYHDVHAPSDKVDFVSSKALSGR